MDLFACWQEGLKKNQCQKMEGEKKTGHMINVVFMH